MEIVEERIKERRRIIELAEKWAKKLEFKVTAILIGSFARGDFNLWSDVDILLVSDELRGRPIDRLKALDYPPGFEVIPVTKREFLKLMKKGNRLAMEASQYGIILRDDLELSKILKQSVPI